MIGLVAAYWLHIEIVMEVVMTGFGRAIGVTLVLGLCGATGCLAPAKSSHAQKDNDGGVDTNSDGGVNGGVDAWVAQPTLAAALISEDFPPGLLLPYPGTAPNYYDDTFIKYPQLKAKVLSIFNDMWIRNGVDEFAARIALFGGVDFVGNVNEARTATPDFLLAIDDMAKDVCAQASTTPSGPFATIDPTTIGDAATLNTKIGQLYQAILYRPATTAEVTAATSLLTDLGTIGSKPPDAWAGLCEGLLHSQDFLFTLAPSYSSLTGTDKSKLLLSRAALDLLGRPPTSADFNELSSGQKMFSNIVDDYLASPDFQAWYFNRMQIRTASTGTDAANEPARLWAYIASQGKPFSDLLVADYTVDTTFAQVTRAAYYGKTGILTMAGFIAGKPGLPHFTYSARVLEDYMGVLFDVTPAIIAMRVGATPASTVTPNTLCFNCHQMLTPLAYQRQRWFDDGTYNLTDSTGVTIDDTDQDLVPSYQFRGEGMEAFSTVAVKKEAFIRTMLDAQYMLTIGRPMRSYQDERTIYKQLWDLNVSSNGNLKTILKAIIMSPVYQGS